MESQFVRQAERLNLGIPYNHHAYFAGAVHQRNEWLGGSIWACFTLLAPARRRASIPWFSCSQTCPAIEYNFSWRGFRRRLLRIVLLADVGDGFLIALVAQATLACGIAWLARQVLLWTSANVCMMILKARICLRWDIVFASRTAFAGYVEVDVPYKVGSALRTLVRGQHIVCRPCDFPRVTAKCAHHFFDTIDIHWP